jgi:hypothetical protein
MTKPNNDLSAPADSTDNRSANNLRNGCLGCSLVIALLVVAGFFAVDRAREAADSNSCSNNLSQLGVALRNYLEKHKSFPPAFLSDDFGKPVNSWRTVILPELTYPFPYGAGDENGHGPKYDLSQRWNSPHNAQLHLDQGGYRELQCPCDERQVSAVTNYVAVVGANTMWSGQEPVTPAADGSDKDKILVIEVIDSDILWMEPRDLTLDQALNSLQATKGTRIGSRHRDGIHYVTVSGELKKLDPNVDRESLRKLLTRD